MNNYASLVSWPVSFYRPVCDLDLVAMTEKESNLPVRPWGQPKSPGSDANVRATLVRFHQRGLQYWPGQQLSLLSNKEPITPPKNNKNTPQLHCGPEEVSFGKVRALMFTRHLLGKSLEVQVQDAEMDRTSGFVFVTDPPLTCS